MGKVGEIVSDIVKSEIVQKKTLDLFGLLFPYAGIEKIAVDKYIEMVEKSDLPATEKLFYIMNSKKNLKRIKNQKSIADIAMANAKPGTDFSKKSGVNEDWLDRFMESASFVSDEEIQIIWGKILANEFENPNSTPPSMIRILSEFTPKLARAFRKICGMEVICYPMDDKNNLLEAEAHHTIFVPFSDNFDTFLEENMSFNTFCELDSLGVIKFDSLGAFVLKHTDAKKFLIQFKDKIKVVAASSNHSVSNGNVLLTEVGKALQKVIEKENFPNYYQLINNYLKKQHAGLIENHGFSVLKGTDGYSIPYKSDSSNINNEQ